VFSSRVPEFSEAHAEQCLRIVAGLRTVNSKVLDLGGSLDALTAAADRVEALIASLDEVTRTRAIESYRGAFDPRAPNDVLPFNPASGVLNPIAPKVEMSVEGKRLVAHCEFARCHEGGPDTAHGGMIATVYDQVLAYATMIEGKTGPTISLKVTYLKPTPVNEPLRFETMVTAIDGRKYTVSGACYRGDVKVSEAEGLMLGAYDIPAAGSPTWGKRG
jgi:acyl-coenzyme A thioesterase PaaI-like protein